MVGNSIKFAYEVVNLLQKVEKSGKNHKKEAKFRQKNLACVNFSVYFIRIVRKDR